MAAGTVIETLSGDVSVTVAGAAQIQDINTEGGDIKVTAADVRLDGQGLRVTLGSGAIDLSVDGQLDMAQSSRISTVSGSLSAVATGDVEVSVIRSDSGSVTLGGRDIHLRDEGVYSAQGAGGVSVTAKGDLTMAAGTELRTADGALRVETGGQMGIWHLASNTGNISLNAEGSIRVVGPDLRPQIVTGGDLDIQSTVGVAGYGFERLYVDVRELTGHNAQTGDVVISGWKGLRLGAAGYHSDSDQGWLVLMSGRAGLVETQGAVTAVGDRVARISGKTVIMPDVLPGRHMQGFNAYVTPPLETLPAADTLEQLNAHLRNDWLAAVSGPSPQQGALGMSNAGSGTGRVLAGHRSAAWGGRAYDDLGAVVQATELLEAALRAASHVKTQDIYAADPLSAWAQRSFTLRQSDQAEVQARAQAPSAPTQQEVASPMQAHSSRHAVVQAAPKHVLEELPVALEVSEDELAWLESSLEQLSIQASEPALVEDSKEDVV
jgi:hypothetical protein